MNKGAGGTCVEDSNKFSDRLLIQEMEKKKKKKKKGRLQGQISRTKPTKKKKERNWSAGHSKKLSDPAFCYLIRADSDYGIV